MEILATRILEGPNIYSYRPVIWIKLDIAQYEDVASKNISGFNEQLLDMLPGLSQHHCSRGKAGGFVERLTEGTYLAHIFEHTVLELQMLVGYDVKFGKTRSTGIPGMYNVIVGCRDAEVAKLAAYIALDLLQAALNQQPFDIEGNLARLLRLGEQRQLGPSTQAILAAAQARDIPATVYNEENLLMLGYGHRRQRVWATITGRTSAVASDLACDKQLTKRILEDNGVLVPYGFVAANADEAVMAARSIGGGVVVKPLTGNQGKGVTININHEAEVRRAYEDAGQYDQNVLVEEYIPGLQYRLCVVNGKLAAAAERIPAYVIGDGQHTVAQLVDIVNNDPDRGDGHGRALTKIKIDAVAIAVLAKQKFAPQSVPPKDKVIRIRDNANLSTGGTAVDITDIVHPVNVRLAERVAGLVGLDVAGIDVVAKDITQPIGRGNGAVIEVNAAPGIRMHHYPSAGKPRDVAASIIDYLFPDKSTGRIPLIAITGTNGKTTVTRMIAHIWRQAGYNVGMTTTDGIYINDECVMGGDTTGPNSARIVLGDSRVEVAVLETARGGIVRGGLAFDKCDIGIVTNITEDHLGQDGIETLADLAYIKSLIVETVRPGGFTLLNADDPYVNEMAARVRAEIIYFSVEPSNVIVRRHLGAGGKAFFTKDGVIYAASGAFARAILPVKEIPVTLGGIALHNLQNAIIAAAACYCAKVPIRYIRQGLSSFAQNRGRLNMLTLGDFRVCIDYGHNPAGYQALINTIRRMGARRLVGVIAAPGDRRDDVTVNVGRIAGQGFDHIYIKEDHDLRGRKPGETAALLRRGVFEAGFADDKVEVILTEVEAVKAALNNAQSGDLIVVFYETYDTVLNAINEFCEELKAADEPVETPYAEIVVAGAKMV
ncbi:Cyanophycin synthetase [bioreactor metagenome]|uniref:Cyanophycin synthetase n=1 Tax=bioreactor metagenome TaxID=1076179 RepID=A0A644TQ03_9ZZZZ|nr:cyanophycin synthetase [Negativicutes bacterium]